MAHDSPGDPEPNLIERAIRGEVEAFGELYDLYVEPIYRFITFQVNGSREAEDLTEVVFLKAFENLPAFRSGRKMTNFKAWIYRIARNSVIDHYRTSKSTLPLDEVPPVVSANPGPEGSVEILEEKERVHRAIDRLDDPFRQVILMRFIAGLSYPETADALELTVNYVRVIQHRALKQLRVILNVEEKRSH